MKNRKPLDAPEVGAQLKNGATSRIVSARLVPAGQRDTITTAIHIPRRTWKLMRAVAFARAQLHGGRASVSALITELVERHRDELEQEGKSRLI